MRIARDEPDWMPMTWAQRAGSPAPAPGHGRGFACAGVAVRLLCHYGFVVRGLQRLQVDTLADNAAMIAAATGAGFTVEGTLRSAAWVHGAFLDETVLGLLAHEWAGRTDPVVREARQEAEEGP